MCCVQIRSEFTDHSAQLGVSRSQCLLYCGRNALCPIHSNAMHSTFWQKASALPGIPGYHQHQCTVCGQPHYLPYLKPSLCVAVQCTVQCSPIYIKCTTQYKASTPRCLICNWIFFDDYCFKIWKLEPENLKLPIFSGVIAYPAGCTVVLYNPRKNKQQHIANPGKKTITAVGWWVLFILLHLCLYYGLETWWW